MRNVLTALVVYFVLSLSLSACGLGNALVGHGTPGPVGSDQAVSATEAGGSASLEKLQSAATWLKESTSNLTEQYQAVLAANPDKADQLKAGWGSTLDRVGEAVTAYDTAVSAADAKSADWKWSVARGLVSQAAGIAMSYALKAAVQ